MTDLNTFNPKRFGMLLPANRVSHLDAEKHFAERQMPADIWMVPQSSTSAESTVPLEAAGTFDVVPGPPSITELARALNCTEGALRPVDLIFKFVYENMDFIANSGLHKVGLGALIDGCGNALDQCDVIIQLLSAAGHTGLFCVVGVIHLSPSQWSNRLGVDTTDIAPASQLLSNGGIGNCCGDGCPYTEPTKYLALNHCWVQVNIGGSAYVFDPDSRHMHTHLEWILEQRLAQKYFSFHQWLYSSAEYIQDISEANIDSDLTTYGKELGLLDQSNKPGVTLDDVIGGRQIVPATGALR